MMRTLVATAILALLLSPALAQPPRSAPQIDYLEVEGSGFADPSDVVQPGKIRRYFSRRPAAAARPGTAFGMTVKVVGQPVGAPVTLRWVWKTPRPGVKDEKTGKVTRVIEEEVPSKIGDRIQHNYEFREQAQIVKGNWNAEIWNGRRRLAVRRFAIR